MGLASFRTKVKLSGTATAMTSQAMSTHSTVANTYRINSTARRVWNPAASLTFYENSGTTGVAAVSAGDISNINRLFGTVTFATTKAGNVSVSGQYLPLASLAGANNYTLNITREQLDDTAFESTGLRSRTSGLLDAALSVSRWDNVDLNIHTALSNDTRVVLEVAPGGSTVTVARGFFKVESEGHSGDVGSLESAEGSFVLDGSSEGAITFGTP